jgi:hypothetical protein
MRKLFKGGKYSREETIRGNTVSVIGFWQNLSTEPSLKGLEEMGKRLRRIYAPKFEGLEKKTECELNNLLTNISPPDLNP